MQAHEPQMSVWTGKPAKKSSDYMADPYCEEQQPPFWYAKCLNPS